MSNILAIESSGSLCTLALMANGHVFSREQEGQRSHTQYMLPFVDELLTEANLDIADLDALAFSAGPGSFTGIRLAASVVKSLAYAADVPVIAVSSLAIIGQTFYRQHPEYKSFSVVTDARMDEVYIGQYCLNREGLVEAKADDQLVKLSELSEACFDKSCIVGDAQPLLASRDGFLASHFISVQAHALDLLPLAEQKLVVGKVENALQAEAIYLRGKSGWKTTAQQLADKKI